MTSPLSNGFVKVGLLVLPFAVPAACIYLADRMDHVELRVEVGSASKASSASAPLTAIASTRGAHIVGAVKNFHVEVDPGMIVRNTSGRAIADPRYRVELVTQEDELAGRNVWKLGHPLAPGEETYVSFAGSPKLGRIAHARFTFFDGKDILACAEAPAAPAPAGGISVSPAGAARPAVVQFADLDWHKAPLLSKETHDRVGGRLRNLSASPIAAGTIYLAGYAKDGTLDEVAAFPVKQLAAGATIPFEFPNLEDDRRAYVLSFEQAGVATGYR